MKRFYTVMFVISIVTLLTSIAALLIFGLNYGADFKGGSVLEIEFNKGRPDTAAVQEILASNPAITELAINTSGERSLVIRSSPLTNEIHQEALRALNKKFAANEPRELRFDSIGPAVG